jgi:hypothetical protein
MNKGAPWLYHPECSVMAEHSINQCYQIQIDKIMALAKLPYYTTRIICKATEISLQNNFNRDRGYQISPAWKNIIHTLRTREDATAIPKQQIPLWGQ